MLTRQWQVGEFRGEDAGSPVLAKATVATTRLTRVRPGDGPALPFDETVPLEAQIERLPWHPTIAGDKVALDLRLAAGRRWLKLIDGIGSYAALYAAKYRFKQPDPQSASDAAVCAHPEVWQAFAAAAGRAVDGIALYEYLTGRTGRHAYDGLAVLDVHKPAHDDAAAFVAWVDRMITRPAAGENPAWQPGRLEYRFACSAPVEGGEKVYVADEYQSGTLDWHSVDVDPAADPLAEDASDAPDPRTTITRTMVPVPLTYSGMPTRAGGRSRTGARTSATSSPARPTWRSFCSSSSGSCTRTTGSWCR